MRPSKPLIIALATSACGNEVNISPDLKDTDPPIDTDPGIGIPFPDIVVSPPELRFGQLPPGCESEPQLVTIENIGQATLQVDGVSVGGAGAGAFTVSESGPFSLEPGESLQVEIAFAAPAYAQYGARVTVDSNDPDTPRARVAVVGAGALAATREEIFFQESASAVDVLWVIDTSSSMEEDVARVAQAMDRFIQNFVNLGLDYQLGVTTTDMQREDGRLLGPVMDASTSNIRNSFTSQVASAGTAGSTIERGFAASRRAIERAIAGDGYNAGLVRTDATLAVVVVSDEDDRDASVEGSGAQRPQVTDDYVTWLKSQKGDPDHVSFSAFTGPAGGSGLLAGSTQYHRAINATGGTWGDIGNPDIGDFLQHLSFVAAGLEYRFVLQERPTSTSPAQLTVEVNGVEVPFGPPNGWTYDSQENAIVFWGDSIPDPGDDVLVTYPYDAGCE